MSRLDMNERRKKYELSRRDFVEKGVASTLLLTAPAQLLAVANDAAVPQLIGPDVRLDIGYAEINITGKNRRATLINGSLPGPTLRWREGDRVRITVHNHLEETTSIHWHGLILPTEMDGVPGISPGFSGIAPGTAFTYEFDIGQSGTYWYHSHSGFQEQTGVYGAIIIEPREPITAWDQENIVLLSDWSDESPADVFRTLKRNPEIFNINPRTLAQTLDDFRKKGVGRTVRERAMWNEMRMSASDISDVTGATYTFLLNGQSAANGWECGFQPGERMLLRFVNAAAMTIFDTRIPGLKMTVVAADGQAVQPVTVDEFRIAPAETYDVIVQPEESIPYTIFSQAIDRSGYALGTLSSLGGQRGDVPPLDPPPLLSHADMGMGSSHEGHTTSGTNPMNSHHAHHGHHSAKPQMGSGAVGYGSNLPIEHDPGEYGPHVDMRAEEPMYRLDDPGVGLRENGRRVLTYADLRRLDETTDKREPDRELQLHLTGNMHRYMWSINGQRFADAEPLHLNLGERVRITLVNDTMMNHPIHLHGLWSELETGDGNHLPRKHTVIVQPGAKISYLVTADAEGHWAYHCHLLYHMMGMFREVIVS